MNGSRDDHHVPNVAVAAAVATEPFASCLNEQRSMNPTSKTPPPEATPQAPKNLATDAEESSTDDDPAHAVESRESQQRGRWSSTEQELFLRGLHLYGRRWTKIAQIIGTRTTAQVRSHAQKFEMKVRKVSKAASASRRLASLVHRLSSVIVLASSAQPVLPLPVPTIRAPPVLSEERTLQPWLFFPHTLLPDLDAQ